MSETVISSFILRFIQESDADLPWRGVVRHVQSDEESRFTRMEEALRFIGRFVEVDGDTTADGGQRMGVRPHELLGLDGEVAGDTTADREQRMGVRPHDQFGLDGEG